MDQTPFKRTILEASDVILSHTEKTMWISSPLSLDTMGGFKRLILGSVSSSLVQYAKCPVLVVK